MLSLDDKIQISFYIFLSIVAIICLSIYVGIITDEIFRYGRITPDINDTLLRKYVSGALITFGTFLGLGVVALIMQIVIILERDYVKKKKLQKHLINVLIAFPLFLIATFIILVRVVKRFDKVQPKPQNQSATYEKIVDPQQTERQYSKSRAGSPVPVY